MADSTYTEDVTTATFADIVLERSDEVPVLVDFWATWCGPCRILGPVLEKLAREFEGGFILAKVDTDREQELAIQFKIRSIPTVMLFKGGKVVAGFPGALPEGRIRSFLASNGVTKGGQVETWVEDPAQRVIELEAAIHADPERTDLHLLLALALDEAGEGDKARVALEALPAAEYADPRAVRARARLALAATTTGLPDGDPVRLGAEAVLTGRTAEGLDILLEALRWQREQDEPPARAVLLEALQTVADEELLRDTRRRMAAVLF